MSDDNVHHLSPRRKPRSPQEDVQRAVELAIAAHFREQNDLLRQINANLGEMNRSLTERVQQLANSVGRLLEETDGVRTGDKDSAFARVAATDACADLPTVAADVANFYPHTSTKIGSLLGFRAEQIGQLLGQKGLKWAGNPDFQEMTRWQNGHPRYWHADVPERLRKILT